MQVYLYRPFFDPQPAGNYLICEPFSDEANDFDFPSRQQTSSGVIVKPII